MTDKIISTERNEQDETSANQCPYGSNVAEKMGTFTKGLVVWLADLVSVVLIVLCNKALMSPPTSFRFPVTLTAAHFTFTALVSRASMYLSTSWSAKQQTADPRQESAAASVPASVPAQMTAFFVLVSAAAIITVNASLLLNSVAFYQIMKMLTLPLVAAFEAWSGTKHYDRQHLAVFAVILIGVGMTAEGDMDSSIGGTLVASASVVFAAASQILCGRLQEQYQISPTSLLSIVSPYKALLLVMAGPALDRVFFAKSWITDFAWTSRAVQLLLISCILAVAVNLTQYTAIRLLGPGIYSALGQVKTSTLVLLGSLAFQGRASVQQITGTGLAISAVWYMAWLKRSTPQVPVVAIPLSKQMVVDTAPAGGR